MAALLIVIIFYCHSVAAVDPQERAALVDFYQQCGGKYWVHQANWLNGDPCLNNWYGVYCNGTNNSHVTIFDPIPRLSFNYIHCKVRHHSFTYACS